MHVSAALGIPVWAVALVFAALTPFAARAWASWVDRRMRERSARLLAPLGSTAASVRRTKPSDASEASTMRSPGA